MNKAVLKFMLIFMNIISFSCLTYSQTKNIKFDQIGLEQGLSQSTVNAIVQDKYGFMWFGTQDGLNRYDGYSIKVFKNDPGDINSLSDNNIWCLLSDSNGDLWIGTLIGGLNKYVINEKKFYRYKNYSVTSLFEDSQKNIWLGTDKGAYIYQRGTDNFITIEEYMNITIEQSAFRNNSVLSICEDHKGNLWYATKNGLLKLKVNYKQKSDDPSASLIHYKNDPLDINSLSSDNIVNLFPDSEGKLWIGTWGAGMSTYDDEQNKFEHISFEEITSGYIASIYEDNNKNIWLATYNAGLLLHDRSNNSFAKILEEDIRVLYEDNSGILWLGTYTNGIKLLDPNKNRFVTSLSDEMISAILEDAEGEVWVGTYGAGLYHLDNTLKLNKKYIYNSKEKYSISSNKIFALSEDTNNNIWIGTFEGGLNCFNKKTRKFTRYQHDSKDSNSLRFNEVTSLYYDETRELIWIGYLNGGITSFNPSGNEFNHYGTERNQYDVVPDYTISIIMQGEGNNLIIGTLKKGLYLFDPDNNSFEHLDKVTDKSIRLSEIGIHTVYVDDGNLWIGTTGYGIIKYNKTEEKFISFTEKDGLSNNVVYGILPDAYGNLWISTNKGISKFNIAEETFIKYDSKDGLQSNEFNQGAYFEGNNGTLFFGGVNGLNTFSPEQIKNNEYIPPVYITSFKLFDEELELPFPVPAETEIELNYSQNFFSFEFVALNYSSPEKNQYAYKLAGFDKDWHRVTAQQRYASYTNLDPGEYTLYVKGTNNDGFWNDEGNMLKIVITPPFWMTWWFRLITLLIVVLAVIATIRYFVLKKLRERTRIIEQETAIERERLRIARDMHDDLGAKVTQISILAELAKRFLTRNSKGVSEIPVQNHIEEISIIGKRVVSALDEIVWSVNPKNDTLESLVDYIIQHTEQFLSHTGIKYRLDIPPDIPAIPVLFDIRHNLFMMIQEALNNIVKHSRATEVCILFLIEKSELRILLKDNGKGFEYLNQTDLSASNNINNGSLTNGLNNMKKRVEEIGGKFSVNSIVGQGTEITAEVSLNNKPKKLHPFR